MRQTGWKQADLARQLGWLPQHLNNYFTERSEPGLAKIAEIAAVFGVSVAELFQEEGPPGPRITPNYFEEIVRKSLRLDVTDQEGLVQIIDRLLAKKKAKATIPNEDVG